MAIESVTTSGDEQATPEFLATQDFEQLLSKSDVDKLEEAARSYGINRRIGYGILSRSKEFLTEQAEENPGDSVEAYLGMVQHIQEYKEHLGHLLEQARTAEVRALIMAATMAQRAEAVQA